MASIDLIQKEATKFSIVSIAAACVIAAQAILIIFTSILRPQNFAVVLILQIILPLAILVMNAYALVFSLRYPEYDRKLPIIGTLISIATLTYVIILFVTTF